MSKPESCIGCPLYEKGDGPVPGHGPDSPHLVIVGEAPGQDEARERLPFIGALGRVLRSLLREVGVNPTTCYITNTVKCRPPANATPERETVEFCAKRYLLPELEAHGGCNLLAVGTVASQHLVGEKITECAGYAFPREEGGFIVPVLHPAALMRSPADIPITKAFIHKAATVKTLYEAKFKLNIPITDYADFIARCKAGRYIVFDTETKGFEDLTMTCIGISSMSGETVTMPWNTQVAHHVRQLMEDPTVQKIAYNVRFDARALRFNGIDLAGDWIDLMRLVHLDDIGSSRMSLEAIAPYYLMVESWKRKASTEGLLVYNAKDTNHEWAIYRAIESKLSGTRRWTLFNRQLVLDRVLDRMETLGFALDVPRLRSVEVDAKARYESKIAEWNELYPCNTFDKKGKPRPPYNPHSPQQVIELARKLKVRLWKDHTGSISTQERYLKLSMASCDSKGREMLSRLLELRGLRKVISTYLEYQPAPDGALHTSIRSTGTVSGRFSFANPNLGNIPKSKDDFGVRKVFVARPGYTLVGADWSQAESRITALLAAEEQMLNVWAEGRDVHKFVASKLFGCTEEEVTKQQRQLSKTILYGLSYGAGPRKLAETAEISFKDATLFLEKFRKAFPRYMECLATWNAQAEQEGYLANPFGRVHTFSGDRVATQSRNYIPQSSVADAMLIVMCQLWGELEERGMQTRMIMQLYDALVLESPHNEVEDAKEILHRYMNQAWPELHGAVIPAKVVTGLTWADLD